MFNSPKSSLQIIKRFYAKIVLLLLSFLFLALFVIVAGLSDVKYDLYSLNSKVKLSISNSFTMVKNDIFLRSKLIEAGLESALFDENTTKNDFYSAFYILNKDLNLLYSRRFDEASDITVDNMPWLNDAYPGKFIISNSVYKNKYVKGIYIAYGLKNGNKILVQVNQNRLQSRVDVDYDERIKAYTYLVDKYGNFSRDKFYREFDQSLFDPYISLGEQFKEDKIIYSLKHMNFYLISYMKEYNIFVITASTKHFQIFMQFLLVWLSLICFVGFSIFWFMDAKFIKGKVLPALNSLKDSLDGNEEEIKQGLNVIEFEDIRKGINKLKLETIRATDEMEKYKSRFGYIFEQSFLKIVVYDAYAGDIVDASNAFLHSFGYTKDEIIKLNLSDLIDGDFALFMQTKQDAQNSDVSFKIKLKTKDGNVREGFLQESQVKLRDARLNFMLIREPDEGKITQKDDDALNDYTFLSPNVIAEALKDDPFSITRSTKNIDAIFKVPQDEKLINLKNLLSPESLDEFVASVLTEAKNFFENGSQNSEISIITNMQTNENRKAPFKVKVKFVGSNDGEEQRIMYFFNDLSDVSKLQEKYDIELKQFQVILWASEALVFSWDKKSDTLYIPNAIAKSLGYTLSGDMSVNFERAKTIFVDEFTSFKNFFDLIKKGDEYNGEVRLYRADKEIIYVKIRARAISFENNEASVIKGTMQDLSMQNSFFTYQDLLAKIFSYSKEQIVMLDDELRVVDANDAFFDTFNAKKDEIFLDRICSRDITSLKTGLKDIRNEILLSLKKEGYWQGLVYDVQSKNRLEIISISALLNAFSEHEGYLLLASSANDERYNKEYLEFIAYHDPLTGLPNRFLLFNKLESFLKQVNKGIKIAAFYVDFDDFKSVNDGYGHQVGDKLLVEVSKKIDEIFPKQGVFARIGGDEFIGIASYENLGEIYETADNILRIAKEKNSIEEGDIKLSVSVGISLSRDALSADDLLERADWAMYQAKLDGKNKYYLFNAKKDNYFKNEYRDGSKILKAIEAGEMFLLYQPEVDIKTGKIISFEAFIRWKNGDKVLKPSDFLPLTKASKAAIAIALFALKNALKARELWLKEGIDAKVRVNLGIKKLLTAEFFEKFKEILKDENLDASGLIIDIVDAANGANLDDVSNYIDAYKELGVSFSLDDFASYSGSIEALGMLKANRFNVDKRFCKQIFSSKEALETMRMIRYISSTFKLDAMIKNIEDKSIFEIFLGFGFTRFQGRFFATELSLDEAVKFKFILPSYSDVKDYQNDENYEILYKIVGTKELMYRVINSLKRDNKISLRLKKEIVNYKNNIKKIDVNLAEILDGIISKEEKEDIVNLAKDAIKLSDSVLKLNGDHNE